MARGNLTIYIQVGRPTIGEEIFAIQGWSLGLSAKKSAKFSSKLSTNRLHGSTHVAVSIFLMILFDNERNFDHDCRCCNDLIIFTQLFKVLK